MSRLTTAQLFRIALCCFAVSLSCCAIVVAVALTR